MLLSSEVFFMSARTEKSCVHVHTYEKRLTAETMLKMHLLIIYKAWAVDQHLILTTQEEPKASRSKLGIPCLYLTSDSRGHAYPYSLASTISYIGECNSQNPDIYPCNSRVRCMRQNYNWPETLSEQ